MSNRRQKRRLSGPGALPAILAVLALLLQALVPGMAVAQSGGSAGGTRTVVLCTSMGEKTVTLPDDSAPRPVMASKCHDCVMAAVTAVVPPSAHSLPVRYAAIVRHEMAQAWRAPEPARPPPRPPSQGPPTLFDL